MRGQIGFSRTIMFKYIFCGKGVKQIGWRIFDRFSYLTSSCCLFFSSMRNIVLPLLPSSVAFLLSRVVITIWQTTRLMQGQLVKIFLSSNEVTSYPLPRVYGVVRWLISILILILWPLLKFCLQSHALCDYYVLPMQHFEPWTFMQMYCFCYSR